MAENRMEVLREAGEFLKDNAKKNLGTFKFNNQIKELSDTSVFNPNEIVWLRYRKDLVKKMYDNRVASGMIYFLVKSSNVFYIRQLARKLGTYDRNVRTWVDKLYKRGSDEASLLSIHPKTNYDDDNIVWYQVSENKTNLLRGIFEGLVRYYSEKEGKSLNDLTKDNPKGSSKSREVFEKYRNKNNPRRGSLYY